MSKTVTKEEAVAALNNLKEDFELLSDGSWVPDEDSCQASMDNVDKVLTYIKELGYVEAS